MTQNFVYVFHCWAVKFLGARSSGRQNLLCRT